MTTVQKVVVPHLYREDDVSTLRMLFPHLDRNDAIAILRTEGDLGRAASFLVDIEEVEGDNSDAEDAGNGVHEVRDLPAHLKCPKCFSNDILLEEETQTVVCLSCHHHFTESQAKRGKAHVVGHSKKEKPPKQRKQHRRTSSPKASASPKCERYDAHGRPHPHPCDETNMNKHDKSFLSSSSADECGSSADETVTSPELPEETVETAESLGIPGPALQKLYNTRALKAAKPTLRLVVSHASSPNDKRVITVPMEGGFTSLLKQARAKFRLRKPLKGVRVLPEGSPVANLDALPPGSEVLVTFNSEFPNAKRSQSPSANDAAHVTPAATIPLSATKVSQQETTKESDTPELMTQGQVIPQT